MAGSAPGSVEPLVYQLQFAVTTLLPAFTVVGALLAFAANRGAARRTIFSNIITDADIEEELALGNLESTRPFDGSSGSPLSEATPLLPGTGAPKARAHHSRNSLLFVAIGVLELAGRIALLVNAAKSGNAVVALSASICVWTYATLLPLVAPPSRPPYPLFIIYILAMFQALIDVYLYGIMNSSGSHSLDTVRVLYIAHLALCTLGFLLVLAMPLNPYIGKPDLDKEGPSPAMDDYATLGQWMSVSWLATIMRRASTGALEDSDVPHLAIDVRSRLLARKFASFRTGRSLLGRIFFANLSDIALNFSLSIAGAMLSAVQPILLNRILSAIEVPRTDTTTSLQSTNGKYNLFTLLWAPKEIYQRDVRTAYLFAALSFAAMAMKAYQSVLSGQLMRRAVIRARAEVVGEIYTKALTRIDTSGIVGPKTNAVSLL